MNRLWAYHSLNHLSIQSLQDLGIRWNDEKGGFEQIPDQPTLKGYWLRCKGRRVWIQPGGSQCCFDKKCDQYFCPMDLIANIVWKSTASPQKKSCHQLCPLGRPGHLRVLSVGKMMVIMAYRVATWIQIVPFFLMHVKTYTLLWLGPCMLLKSTTSKECKIKQ